MGQGVPEMVIVNLRKVLQVFTIGSVRGITSITKQNVMKMKEETWSMVHECVREDRGEEAGAEREDETERD